jgi:transposase
MATRYKRVNRSQGYLMPPSLEDWLEEGHLARFVVEIVEQLDLSALYREYGGRGGSEAYDPKMLLALLFYGYATGVFSSRKIERATYDSVAFRYIAANTHPDHDTIATFRRRFLPQIETLFVQILMIAKEAGLLKLGHVSLDGTKIRANASKHKALSYAYAQKLEAQLKEEIAQLMEQAERADQIRTEEGWDLPEEIARREERLKVIEAAKAKIEARARERYEQERAQYDEKMQARKAKEERSGKRPGGRPPQAPTEGPRPKDQVNLTDEASRIMPISGGGFEQCYNAQASAEHESLLLVHAHLSQKSNDKQEIVPTLRWFQNHPSLRPETMVADNGYFSASNVEVCATEGITPLFALGRDKHNLPLDERLFTQPPEDPLPPEATPLQAMRHRLQTPEGKGLYARRKSVIEPIFGIIKRVMGFRQFLLRGVEKVQGEWQLVCLAYNLRRLHTLVRA